MQNFGNEFEANSVTFNTLTDTNSNMATGISTLQDQLNTITAQLQQMNAAGHQIHMAIDIPQAYHQYPVISQAPPQYQLPHQQAN